MPQSDRGLSKKEVVELERKLARPDQTADRLGARVYRGSIEEIEERKFPWLKRRRRGR